MFALGMCCRGNEAILGFTFQRALANLNFPTCLLRLSETLQFGKPVSKLDLGPQ